MYVLTLTNMTHLPVILSLERPEEGKSYSSVFLEYMLTPLSTKLLLLTAVSEFSLVKPLDN